MYLLVRKLVPVHRGQGETEERGRLSDWQVAGLISNELGRLDLGIHQTSASLHLPARILKFIQKL